MRAWQPPVRRQPHANATRACLHGPAADEAAIASSRAPRGMRQNECVGSAGIRRRKRRHATDTPPSERISEGDVGRLFGRFTWDPYTPAGSLERNGFLWRQLRRRRRRDGWTYVSYVVFGIFALPFALLAIDGLVHLAALL